MINTLHTLPRARSAGLMSLVLALAACGGGTDSSTPTPTQPAALSLSGTAATGAAIAGGAVEAKCATGTGTATTQANGGYSMSITGGALPCVLRVTAGSVVLHSVATGSGSSAQANLTPVTELVVARLAGSAASAYFSSFSGSVSRRRGADRRRRGGRYLEGRRRRSHHRRQPVQRHAGRRQRQHRGRRLRPGAGHPEDPARGQRNHPGGPGRHRGRHVTGSASRRVQRHRCGARGAATAARRRHLRRLAQRHLPFRQGSAVSRQPVLHRQGLARRQHADDRRPGRPNGRRHADTGARRALPVQSQRRQ